MTTYLHGFQICTKGSTRIRQHLRCYLLPQQRAFSLPCSRQSQPRTQLWCSTPISGVFMGRPRPSHLIEDLSSSQPLWMNFVTWQVSSKNSVLEAIRRRMEILKSIISICNWGYVPSSTISKITGQSCCLRSTSRKQWHRTHLQAWPLQWWKMGTQPCMSYDWLERVRNTRTFKNTARNKPIDKRLVPSREGSENVSHGPRLIWPWHKSIRGNKPIKATENLTSMSKTGSMSPRTICRHSNDPRKASTSPIQAHSRSSQRKVIPSSSHYQPICEYTLSFTQTGSAKPKSTRSRDNVRFHHRQTSSMIKQSMRSRKYWLLAPIIRSSNIKSSGSDTKMTSNGIMQPVSRVAHISYEIITKPILPCLDLRYDYSIGWIPSTMTPQMPTIRTTICPHHPPLFLSHAGHSAEEYSGLSWPYTNKKKKKKKKQENPTNRGRLHEASEGGGEWCNGAVRLRPSHDVARPPIQLRDHSIASPPSPLENRTHAG